MFNVQGFTINLSAGDTGAIRIIANATLDGEAFTFGSDDRALFSIKSATGVVVMEKQFQMTDNVFTVYFLNGDTDSLAPGSNYTWDVRYIIHPYYDANGRIIDGDQVITPKEPQIMQIITVVGNV